MARPSNMVGPTPRSGTRIVHMTTRFLGSGAERSIAAAVEALPAPEFEHILVVGRDHNVRSINSLCGDIPFIVARNLIRRPDPVHDVLGFIELARLTRRLRPDILHTIESKSGILGRAAGRLVGVPRVVHTVNMANFGPGFHPLMSAIYVRLERLAARWTDAFVVNGTELRDRYARARIVPAERFVLVRSAVDVEPFRLAKSRGRDAARVALDLPMDRPTILFAGALDTRKGSLELPRFLGGVRESLPDAFLVIAGRGPLENQIRREMAARGLDGSVRFLGFTRQLPEAMAAADCLIMLSSAEGLATVLLHASAAGTPFVSYEVDGPGELIDLGARGAVAPLRDLQRAIKLTVEMVRSGRGRQLDLADWAPDEVRRHYAAVFRDLIPRELAG